MRSAAFLKPKTKTMPEWVAEQNDHLRAPTPPSPGHNGDKLHETSMTSKQNKQSPVEPDYEVIEFSQQQNSSRTSSANSDSKRKCTLCGSPNPLLNCNECVQQLFCVSCDEMFHKHPKRQHHTRKVIDLNKPALPPKMGSNPTAATPPMAPPRRHKRGDFLTPLLRRKERDQVNHIRGSFAVSASPTPSLTSSTWDERMDTLKRSFLMNRPLPDTPKSQQHHPKDEQLSRSNTPKSVFDNIQRPPSVTLEKIKNKANATFDRMQALQQRYREQREHRERSLSVSNQNHRAFDQWSNISSASTHLRTASIPSGINTSHLNLLFHNHQMRNVEQQQGHLHDANTTVNRIPENQLNSKNLSTSVFNLRRPSHRMPTDDHVCMQQVQSMAHLNCNNNSMRWQSPPNTPLSPEPWHRELNAYPRHWNCSNLSLNIPPGYVLQPAPTKLYPPPMMIHPQRGYTTNMYPNPYMEPAEPVLAPGLPPPFSRPVSRLVSPACSRKSVTLRRKHRPNYLADQAADDEDSEFDDRRSMVSNRSDISKLHRRRLSNSSQSYYEKDATNQHKSSKGHRRDSITKPAYSGWTANNKISSNNARSTDSTVNSSQISSRIYSDIDSSGSGTRALVQAKIQQKLKEEDNLKQKKIKNKTKSTKYTKIPVRHVEKQTIAVQTPAFKLVKSSKDSNETSKSESEDEPTQIPYKNKEQNQPENQPETSQLEHETDGKEQTAIDTLGPPPSTPKYEWECEFCTFINEPNTKICSICCKTPKQQPKPPSDANTPSEPGISTTVTTSKTKNGPPHLDQTKSYASQAITSQKNSTKSLDNSNATQIVSEKETLDEVWKHLDESIQAKADEINSKTKADIVNGNAQATSKIGREVGTSPPPQNISTQTYDLLPLNDLKTTQDNTNLTKIYSTKPVVEDRIEESDLYNYTSEELNAALKYCGSNTHPLVWLRDHWPKLITTVQTLATKYGQEHAENTIGTISRLEARNALRLHTGNVWRAVSECIEQRKAKFHEIAKNSNFSREDIVSAITIHQGDIKQALIDLERTQAKPFLMRIRGSPCGIENESSVVPNFLHDNKNQADDSSQTSMKCHIDPDLNDFLRANASDCMQLINTDNAYISNDQKPSLYCHLTPNCSNLDKLKTTSDNTISNCSKTQTCKTKQDNNLSEAINDIIGNNKHMLKDLEMLIDNIEQKQAQQKEDGQLAKRYPTDRRNSPYESENIRILTKSPIAATKCKKDLIPNQNQSQDESIKQFIRQHIQEILPNLVQQVELELMDGNVEEEESQQRDEENITDDLPPHVPSVPPPLDPEEYIMAELITPNIVFGRSREEVSPSYVYVSEIAPFRIEYDRGTQKLHEHNYKLSSTNNASKVVYKMYIGNEDSNPANDVVRAESLSQPDKSPALEKSSNSNQILKSKSAMTLNTNLQSAKKVATSLTPEPQMQKPTNSKDVMVRTAEKDTLKKSKIPVRSKSSLKPSIVQNRMENLEAVSKGNAKTSHNSNTDFKSEEFPATEHDLQTNTTANSDISSIEDNQSLTSTNEIFLMMQPTHSTSGDMGSSFTNSSTNSLILQTAKSLIRPDEMQSPKDPSKQNLSDLVKDTQKIIQQMRDEIDIDEFESSEGSDIYTDEFYDESYSQSEGSEEEDIDEEYDDDIQEEEDYEEKEDEGMDLKGNDMNSLEYLEGTTSVLEDTALATDLNASKDLENDSTITDTAKISITEKNTSEKTNAGNDESTVIIEANDNTSTENVASANKNNTEEVINNQRIQVAATETTTNEHYPLEDTSVAIVLLTKNNDQLTDTSANVQISEEVRDSLPSTSNLSKAMDLVVNEKKSMKTHTESKIPKIKEPALNTQKGLKKKSNALSKSFATQRLAPIGINSVKSLRQELLKQSQPKHPELTKPNPPQMLKRKNSINEVINKLTKTNDIHNEIYKVFKSRVQPRIPNKKYHETCFSDDDYESPEEDKVYDLSQRKFSVPVFRAYPNLPKNEEFELTELTDELLKEKLLSTEAEAQIAAALIQMKFEKDVAVWAAKECSDVEHAISLLQQECELCNGIYSLNKIVSMLKCTHKCCQNCAKKYFTVQITERNINDCNCPFCKLPELHNQNEHEDENLEYFSNLDILLKNILDAEVHELFQRKLRDRTLLKDPNFKWCVQCSSGFFARPKQKRLICPDCGSITCALCRKPWQKQHETLTCEKFLEWQLANDPEVQALGVQKHLEQNGIECPKCKFRYSLARGGCMHFTCTQCKFEFCYGCSRPFMMGAKCTVSAYCAKLGLHAHHPRNCLFYLRDKLPIQLQNLLKNNGVDYKMQPMVNMGVEIVTNQSIKTSSYLQRCPVPIQKETPAGLVDTKCNDDVPEEHGGLCRVHYVEYLTAIVAKANIDPLPIFDLTDCVQELRRRGIALPERGPWDTDEIYKNMCAEVIKQNIPLDAV